MLRPRIPARTFTRKYAQTYARPFARPSARARVNVAVCSVCVQDESVRGQADSDAPSAALAVSPSEAAQEAAARRTALLLPLWQRLALEAELVAAIGATRARRATETRAGGRETAVVASEAGAEEA
eukprot:998974-Pleurochrysis_carterae.AAC.1